MMPTEAEIADYRADGAVCLRGVLAPEWLNLLAAGVDRNLREPGPFGKRYTPDGRPGLFFGD
ncbi:MAG: phytanoyl-CoA dioxygenase, partial [Alphaproteobacteria bacterium]